MALLPTLSEKEPMMGRDSPLRKRHESYPGPRRPDDEAAAMRPGAARGARVEAPRVEYVPFGPGDGGEDACTLVATYGDLEAEYAAIRKGAGIFDAAHRGTILVEGGDRLAFLNSMVTQAVGNMRAGSARETFWLNRKGRIEADLLLIELGDRLLIDVDVHLAPATADGLGGFVFTEDVEIRDATSRHHHLAVHGPQARAVLDEAASAAPTLDRLAAGPARIDGVDVVVARRDQTGEPGLELIAPVDGVARVWDALLAAGERVGGGRPRVRPVGWYALNIARVEAGTPLFNIDFGPANLPHETGLLDRRVSFTKGCFLGQEIVARTQNLGRPKQRLVGLRPKRDLLPAAGDAVRVAGEEAPVGVVTSSTLSPMLGAAPIALAMIKSGHAEPGATVLVEAEGEQTEAEVTPTPFYSPSPDGTAGAGS
jgi:folate-binding protein YgfZ